MFSRWKRHGKGRELLEKDGLLDGRASVAETSRSMSRSTYYASSSTTTRDGACSSLSRRPSTSMSKKLSQPVLRAIKSIRHFELLHSISDSDLRGNTGLADSYNQREYSPPAMVDLSPDYSHLCPLPARQRQVHLPMPTVEAESTLVPPTSPSTRPRQQTSRLLALPQEIRDEIYAYVFYSTRLTMGRRVTCAPPTTSYSCPGSSSSTRTISPEPGRHSHSHSQDSQYSHGSQESHDSSQARGSKSSRIITQIKPARHSMALFLVCRQITRELVSDNAWIGQVLFNFEDAATMLDVLGGVFSSPAQRSLIREVRVREGGLFVHQRMPSEPHSPQLSSTPSSSSTATPAAPHHFRQRFLLLGGLMRLLPGLCLDRLTILPALPCRIHKSTRCHNLPSVDMYNMSVTSNPPPPVSLAAPHEILAELLHAGSGWKELCYVHHDTAMLAADKHRPSSLEAMMINMGFWNADMDTYEDVFAATERAEREEREAEAEAAEAEAARLLFLDEDEELQEGEGTIFASSRSQLQRRHRLGSLFASYSARKEYRLPRWRHLLNQRDGLVPAISDAKSSSTSPSTTPGWNVSIDAVIDEGFYEGDMPRSTISVYGVRGGQALWPMETLEDVHDSRIRGEDFMVIVRRGDVDEAEAALRTSNVRKKDNSKALWAESTGNPYPFKEGDPRALGYGSRWETLRPVLFPWDHLAVTRSRRDRYRHRDEYVVRSQRRRG
ncbi:hypothetical protein SBRCBS47491_010236 [Sporothrix bragantina]|uniref:F-box domain containing protein n=1 Tax=Sporothrix bragantina TaxID=671064 RepID=A0ABP0D3Z2_9PEZI